MTPALRSERNPGSSAPGRFWIALGSARTVRIIFICMIVYFLIIGGLVLAYSNVQKCLADYGDVQAESSKARSEAASIDRKLNARYDELSTSERARLRVDQDALLDLMAVLVRGGDIDDNAAQIALEKVKQTNEDSAEIGRVNDKERFALNQERARADALRQLNPVPDAPSETC